MCQCGCGDFQPDFKFKGPGDNWYVVQSYPSCDNCDTPAGVIIYQCDPEAAETWGLEHVKEKTISEMGCLMPILHPEKLKKRFTKFLTEAAEGLVDDLMEECFKPAVHESMEPMART